MFVFTSVSEAVSSLVGTIAGKRSIRRATAGIVLGIALLPGCSDQSEDEVFTAAKQQTGERIELRDVRPLAEAGDAAAQFALSRMHAAGDGVAIDELQMLEWLRRSADQGYAPAQYELGNYYLQNRQQPDYASAARWLRLAAEQGHVSAQTSIGMLYVAGRGVEQDFAQGFAWLSLAAENKDALAREKKAQLLNVLNEQEFHQGLRLMQEYRRIIAGENRS